MPKWEYVTVNLVRSYGMNYRRNGIKMGDWKDLQVFEMLGIMGEDGFELTAYDGQNYIFKRPKAVPQPPAGVAAPGQRPAGAPQPGQRPAGAPQPGQRPPGQPGQMSPGQPRPQSPGAPGGIKPVTKPLPRPQQPRPPAPSDDDS